MDRIPIDPDLELVARIRSGDERAMDTLLRRYQPRLYRYCRRRLDNREDAREAVQDALLAIARGIESFRGGASLASWIFAVARSFCLKKVRRSKFAPLRQDSLDLALERELLPTATQRPPDVTLQTRELVDHLDRAIAELDPADREILLLRDHEGLRAHEVAERLGLSVPAVKSRLHRARQAVRRRLAPLAGPELRTPTTIASGAASRPARGHLGPREEPTGAHDYADLRA